MQPAKVAGTPSTWRINPGATSRKQIVVRYYLSIFMLFECSMFLYSVMMLIKFRVPGLFRLLLKQQGQMNFSEWHRGL